MIRLEGEGRGGKGRRRLEAGGWLLLYPPQMGWIMDGMGWDGLTRALCCSAKFPTLDRPDQLLNCGAASSSPVQNNQSSPVQRSAAQRSAVPRSTTSTAPLPNQKLVLQLTHQAALLRISREYE
jgi:hypothetical protein